MSFVRNVVRGIESAVGEKIARTFSCGATSYMKAVESKYKPPIDGQPERQTNILNFDFRDIDFAGLIGGTENVLANGGKIVYITVRGGASTGTFDSVQSPLTYAAQNLFNSFRTNNSMDLFLRLQSMSINERPLSQVQQTMDGVYAGLYGGSIATIKLSGITGLWSVYNYKKNVNASEPINIEIEALEKLLIIMTNLRGVVFNLHDGFKSRKYGVIPSSFTTHRSVSANNQEMYDLSFIGASFGQNFRHVQTSSTSFVQKLGGPAARYQTANIL